MFETNIYRREAYMDGYDQDYLLLAKRIRIQSEADIEHVYEAKSS